MKRLFAPICLLATLSACQTPRPIFYPSQPSPMPSTAPSPAASPATQLTQFKVALKPELLAPKTQFYDGKLKVSLYINPKADDDPSYCKEGTTGCYDFSRAGGARNAGDGVKAAAEWSFDPAAELSISTDKLRNGDTYALVLRAAANDGCQTTVSASTVRQLRSSSATLYDFLDDSRWSEGDLGVVSDDACIVKSRARFAIVTPDGQLPDNTRMRVHSLNAAIPFDVTLLSDGSEDLLVPGGGEIQVDISAEGYQDFSRTLVVKFPRHPYSGQDDGTSKELIEGSNSFSFNLVKK